MEARRANARKLLASAGFADGLEIELVGRPDLSFSRQIVEVVPQHLAKVGIKCNVKLLDNATYGPLETAGDLPFRCKNDSLRGTDPDDVLILNFKTGSGRNVEAYSDPKVDALLDEQSVTLDQAMDDVTGALRGARGLRPGEDNTFALVTQDKMLETWDQITGVFFLVMIALSSVGLLVGGVGVVAIMMISVTERTREIGVRKALGARRREILWQFLVEAATLTLVGGVVGMVLGSLIAMIVNRVTPIPAVVPLWSVVVAVLASVLTGVGFGMYPAAKAAKLDPVDALRWE